MDGGDMSVRQWLERYGDWLGVSQIIGLMVASVVAFMQSTRGLAVLFSHFASSVASICLFVAGLELDYPVVDVSIASAVGGGALGMALFRLLVSISDRIDKRREAIAEDLVDRAEGLLSKRPEGEQGGPGH